MGFHCTDTQKMKELDSITPGQCFDDCKKVHAIGLLTHINVRVYGTSLDI